MTTVSYLVPKRWIDADFEPEEAAKWMNGCFEPEEAAKWMNACFEPEEAAKWRDAGFDFYEANRWVLFLGYSYSPEEAVKWREAGFDVFEASLEDLAKWLATGLGATAAWNAREAGHTPESFVLSLIDLAKKRWRKDYDRANPRAMYQEPSASSYFADGFVILVNSNGELGRYHVTGAGRLLLVRDTSARSPHRAAVEQGVEVTLVGGTGDSPLLRYHDRADGLPEPESLAAPAFERGHQ
jgi:hypothetical protein